MRTHAQSLTLYRRELAIWKLTLQTDTGTKKEARARETVQARIALLEGMTAHLEIMGAYA